MKKSVKKWLIAASSLVAIGAILFIAVMSVYQWDFSRLSIGHFETNTYEITEEFSDIKLNTETADILFAVSEDHTCKVVCSEEGSMKHSVYVQDNALTVDAGDTEKWYEHIGFVFQTPKVTVYLPETEYASLIIRESTGNVEIPQELRFESADISLSTGDIKIFASVSDFIKICTTTGAIKADHLSADMLDFTASTGSVSLFGVTCKGDMKVTVTTGDVNVKDAECRNLVTNGSTGDVLLKNVIAAEKFYLERSTGDIVFDGSDAAEISAKTDTGDVTGTLLSEKVFLTETLTGNVDVPKTAAGGKCEITTTTGNIRIGIAEQ